MPAQISQSAESSALPAAEFIFGSTAGMREVRIKMEKALDDNLPVLIEGESGTGKEMMARYLHSQSLRASGPFVRVNCGAMPARMLEGEIFGSEIVQGAGPVARGSGSVGVAAGGTLFLDEIADMDLGLQQKLLLALTTGVQESGNRREYLVDSTRFVCASTIDLNLDPSGRALKGLASGFGHHLRLPTLRERKQDIPKLCECLIEKFARNMGRSAPALSPYVLDAFQRWDWPGNIRELENWVARIVIFGTEEAVGLEFMRQMGVGAQVMSRGHRAVRVDATRARRPRRRRKGNRSQD